MKTSGFLIRCWKEEGGGGGARGDDNDEDEDKGGFGEGESDGGGDEKGRSDKVRRGSWSWREMRWISLTGSQKLRLLVGILFVVVGSIVFILGLTEAIHDLHRK